jgi:uncharacterized protein
MESMLRLADRFGVERLVVLGGTLSADFKSDADEIRRINDLTIDLVRRWPERLVGFARLNPGLDPTVVLAEIDRCVLGGGLRGLKLLVWPNARDPRVDGTMARAQELRLPVLCHSWYKTVDYYEGESTPADIAHLAARFPGVTLIAAHLTPAGTRGVQDLQACPNVCVDTSGAQAFAGVLEYAVPRLGAERILYGSDVPGRDFSAQLGRIYAARISEADRRLILEGNARRILGLS